MIKAVINTKSGALFVLGLSHRDLDLLRDGRPIAFSPQDLGLEGAKFVIMAGETEQALQDEITSIAKVPQPTPGPDVS